MEKKTKFVAFFGILAGVSILSAIAGLGYLRSNNFRQFAIGKITGQVNQATGGRAAIGGLDFSLSTLTAHLYNVTLRGSEPGSAPPLLHLDALTVGLKIQSALRRQISLSELVVDHPVVNVEVDGEGRNNFPSPPSSQSSGNPNLFDLAVGHVAVTGGELNYRDQKTPLDADLRGLKTQVSFEPLERRYRGSLSYDSGTMQYATYHAVPHQFRASFNATPGVLTLESATLQLAASTLAFNGTLSDYSNPKISGHYNVKLHSQDFAQFVPAARISGDTTMHGDINYQNRAGQSFLMAVQSSGVIVSDEIAAATAQGHVEIRHVQIPYKIANGSLEARNARADLLGGNLDANLEVSNLDSAPDLKIRTALHGIQLAELQHSLPRSQQTAVALLGRMDGSAIIAFTGGGNNLRGQTDLTIQSSTSANSSKQLPVSGVIHATYDGNHQSVAIRQTRLQTPVLSVSADGEMSRQSRLVLHASAEDLHQVAELVASFLKTPSTIPQVRGSATVDATVTGSTAQPRISAQVRAQDLEVQGSAWRQAAFSIDASPSHIGISDGMLVSAQQGQASFAGSSVLRDWAYSPSSPVKADITVRKMSIANLLHLANLQYPVRGDLSASINITGTQLEPSGHGSVDVANAQAYGEDIQSVNLKFHAQGESIVSHLNLASKAGSADADLTYAPKTKSYNLRLDAPSVVLAKLQTIEAKNLGIQGTVTISARGQGTVDNPQLTGTIEVPALLVRNQPVNGIKAVLNVANHQADATVDTEIAKASIRARGHVELAGDYLVDAVVDTGTIPIDGLLATYANRAPEGFQGQTELHATLRGPLKDKDKLEAHVTIPTLNASYQSLQIGAAGSIKADYAHSVITLQPAEFRGTGTSVRIQGTVPLSGNAPPTLTARGSIDAQILRIADPNVKSSGKVALDVRTAGTASSPQVAGQIRLQDISVETADAPLGVTKLNGNLDFDGDRVQISQMNGIVGGGNLSIGGSLAYRPTPQFDIALHGTSIRLRYPQGLRTLLDSNLTWTGNVQNSTLAGRVVVDQLSFTPDFDLSSFADQFSGVSVPSQPGIAGTINLQIAVQSQDNLSARSSQVSIEGTANLRVIGTASNPVITGRTDLTAGELFYRNVRYQLERGIITFDNPNETRPTLNVALSTVVEQYNLTLNLRGPMDSLTTSYVSDPPLATADIINLIALGKTTSESAASSQSTDSMIASEAASQVSGGVQRLAGISSLQIDPLIGGNNQNPSARLALQQRVTKNFLFTFSTDVSQPGQEIVQGDYKISNRWSVSVERDQLGGVSVDGRFHTKF